MGDALTPISLGSGRTVRQIGVGLGHTCALLDNGQVKCWGYNVYGQLGLEDGQSRGDTPNSMGDALPPVNLGTTAPVRAIAVGESRSCAVFEDGRIKCWGKNTSGELGIGTQTNRGGGVGDMGDGLSFVNLGTGVQVESLSLGAMHSCAILTDHRVKCWGHNGGGSLCDGDVLPRGGATIDMGDNLPYANLGTGRTAVAIRAANDFTCALLDHNGIKCWGTNSDGELGLGTTNPYGGTQATIGDSLPEVDLGTSLPILSLGSGRGHTCVMFSDNSVKCWGANETGQLGLGHTMSLGSAPLQMGTALPFVDLGP
jgi:alpha-tubulin suppressor-like RCC1 family protein